MRPSSRSMLAAAAFATVPFALALRAPQPTPQPTPPDLILHHGRIITVDARDRVVEAIAIRGDRIVAVGSDAEVLRLAGTDTRRIDLAGRAVTPGLLDAHSHFSSGATERYFQLDVSYPAVKGIADIAAAVERRAAAAPPGT
ncbi:MAG: amidohydrolase family protein, partial [Gemmatimonadaceae bacterium]|nr:amidohydrolase family protein [Gemmatimonadaceae bacterium]